MPESPPQRQSPPAVEALQKPASGLAVIMGEILWDCLPDRRVLGGAPLNVAWNLAGFGLQPLLISAVGDDELGHEILATMTSWGLSTEGVAVLPEYPTGTVQVRLLNGQPHYEIVQNVAYDHLTSFSETLASQIEYRVRNAQENGYASVLYHGSLALRHHVSRNSVRQIRNRWHDSVFFDINIRAPHYDPQWLLDLGSGTTLMKLNEDELQAFAGSPIETSESRQAAVASLMDHWQDLQAILLTRGSDGAMCYLRGALEPVCVSAPSPSEMIDAVGAGDAFASVFLNDFLTTIGIKSANAEQMTSWASATLRRAVTHASKVCTLHGATTPSREFYQEWMTFQ